MVLILKVILEERKTASNLLMLFLSSNRLNQTCRKYYPPFKTLTFFQISFPRSLNKESIGKENDLGSQWNGGQFFKVFYRLARVDTLD